MSYFYCVKEFRRGVVPMGGIGAWLTIVGKRSPKLLTWQLYSPVLLLALVMITGIEQGLSNVTITQTQPSVTAQVLPSPRATPQGAQIVLNGRTLPVNWMQWQATTGSPLRTGISDMGLMQAIGIDLLNTEDATKQPVQWFSPLTTNSQTLPTRFANGFRYLDITDLAQQVGWRMQVSGNTLQITSPAAKVLALRQGKQPWGDRLVLDLDRAAPWQVDPQAQEVILTVDAQIAPTVLQAFRASAGNLVQSVKLESATNQTRIRLGVPAGLRPRVWTLAAPNRIIIDVRPDALVERSLLWSPGLRWRQQLVTLGADRFPVVWLEVNPRQPGLSVRPILPNPTTMTGTAPLLQTARQNQVAAAINGGFFNRNNQLPLGAVRRDDRWFSGPILNRGAIAWNAAGETKFDRLTLQETVITTTGQRLPLTHLNSGYVQAGIARYTPDWGATYLPMTDNEILITVQGNRVVGQQTIAKAGSPPIPVPADGYLLVLRSNQSAASAFIPGSLLTLESTTNPPDFARYPHIVAAGPLLLQNRQVVLNAQAEQFSNAFTIEKAVRSAIGRMANGNLLIVTAHHRLGGAGATLTEMAQLMQQLGAIDAVNLDGGSSTTLYLGGQILDRPARTAARVHNGIGIFIQP
ncbi:phosphodiester glycosidase family protein [Pantanalinema rosaneae CENA516]|uniref:phosphodiester glycosidase family protein n=1 Tax=Pantanalinema rosaneae TaxID=1620701 RepID=UPI003D6DBA36